MLILNPFEPWPGRLALPACERAGVRVLARVVDYGGIFHDDVPDEEDLEQTDSDVKDIDMKPEDHVNRPDQPDFDPAERRQYQEPRAETALADADHPEDR